MAIRAPAVTGPIDEANKTDPLVYAGFSVEDAGQPATHDPNVVQSVRFGLYAQNQLLKLAVGAACVRNETGGTLAKGSLVYASGWSAAEGAFLISLADADDPAHRAMWVLAASLATATNGLAWGIGDVTGLDTSGAGAVGDPVYLSGTAGAWTYTAPTVIGKIIQCVGRVTVKDVAGGAIRFFPALGAVQPILRSKVEAKRTADQAIGTGAWTKVQFNVEVTDALGEFDPVTNYRFTATLAGRYLVTAAVVWAGNATGQRAIMAYINGVSSFRFVGNPATSAADWVGLDYGQVFDLAAGDYVELYAYQASGGNLNVVANYTWLSITRIA